MILNHLRQEHDVANDVRVLRHLNAQRILDAADAGERMDGGAHSADALAKRPGIARTASLQNDFDAAPGN